MGSGHSKGISGKRGKPSGADDDSSSNVRAKRRRGGSAYLDMTKGEDVKGLLECPVCKEILVPPIQQCQRGHRVCNTCIPKLTKCHSCDDAVGTSRNSALETILKTAFFSCDHQAKGCNAFLKIQDLRQHHEECDFRPLKCHLSEMDDCNGTLLYLTDTLRHLQETHKLSTIQSESEEGQPNNVFKSQHRVYVDDSDVEDSNGIILESELFHFDENFFVSLIRTHGALTYFGFYLIGPKSDASKYSVKIAIQSSAQDATFKNENTAKITSIRDFQEVWEDWKLPHEVIVHDDVLHRDTDVILAGSDIAQENPDWSIVYTINKI